MQTVVGRREVLERQLRVWIAHGHLLEKPPPAIRLPDGQWLLTVRLHPRAIVQRRNWPAPLAGTTAAPRPRPGLGRRDRRIAATVALVTLIGGVAYLAGASGYGLSILATVGAGVLALGIVAVLAFAAVGEIRDGGR